LCDLLWCGLGGWASPHRLPRAVVGDLASFFHGQAHPLQAGLCLV